MNPTVRIDLQPAGRCLSVATGQSLQDALFAEGVEFPCGGRGRCRGCRVKVVKGVSAATPEDRASFEPGEIEDGWRLACRICAESDLTLELAQWEALILGDDTVFAFTPREGLGVAVDLGTTTLVAQLVDLRTARVLGVRSALNNQARHGADLMTRLDFALKQGGGTILADSVRGQLAGMLRELVAGIGPEGGGGAVREVVLVGNTVMHHLFSGLSVEGLARHPFAPTDPGPWRVPPAALGWSEVLPSADTRITFLPCLGGFVGSDILAGVLAVGLHEQEFPGALVDLGTNGEIVVGNRDRLLCASTAAGPAFEGARIGMGMRAATGAIAGVLRDGDGLVCHVIGGGPPRGICGSGLVDVVAAGLDLGWVQPSGRLLGGQPLRLVPPVEVTQCDVRELQLAKGAIAAGLRILAARWGTALDSLVSVHLAGAFGNYIRRTSARRIGLLPFAPEGVRAAGNTALLGAKLALFRPEREADAGYAGLRGRIEHVALSDDPAFMDTYVGEMGFPGRIG